MIDLQSFVDFMSTSSGVKSTKGCKTSTKDSKGFYFSILNNNNIHAVIVIIMC